MEPQLDRVPADEEEILPIDDDRVPAAVREFALQYRTPVAYAVIGSGGDSAALFSADCELVDLVRFETPRQPVPAVPVPARLLLVGVVGVVGLIVLYPVAAVVWFVVEALAHRPSYWPMASLLLGVVVLATFLVLRLNRILR